MSVILFIMLILNFVINYTVGKESTLVGLFERSPEMRSTAD